jgi:general secretion pathway protein G
MARLFTAFCWVTALVLVAGPRGSANADPSPPTQKERTAPASTVEKKDYHLSTMIVKDIKTIEAFISGETETTLNEMMEALGKTFFPLMEKEGENGTVFSYPAIFVYHGASADPHKKVKLSTGFPVKPDAKAIGDFKVKKLEGYRCASVYFTGSLMHIGDAYGELMAQVAKAGHKPTGQTRELYLFWDGDDSPNTVVEIQVGIAEVPKDEKKPGATIDGVRPALAQAKVNATRIAIRKLETQAQVFTLDVGRYPATLAELQTKPSDEKSAGKWRGPYVEKMDLLDAWGHEMSYASLTEPKSGKSIQITSYGADGKAGTADDISNLRD